MTGSKPLLRAVGSWPAGGVLVWGEQTHCWAGQSAMDRPAEHSFEKNKSIADPNSRQWAVGRLDSLPYTRTKPLLGACDRSSGMPPVCQPRGGRKGSPRRERDAGED